MSKGPPFYGNIIKGTGSSEVDEEIHIVSMFGVDTTYCFANNTVSGFDLCPAAFDGVEDLNVFASGVEGVRAGEAVG